MAFKPRGGPSTSSNVAAGVGAPPTMMMFNPAQFAQPVAPQIPPQIPTASSSNALPDVNNIQDRSNAPPVSSNDTFQPNQQFQPSLSTPNPSHPQPDSTSNVYQNEGLYSNYNNFAPIPNHPSYAAGEWNYNEGNVSNVAPQYAHQQPQPSEQYVDSIGNTYDPNQQPLYENYHPHGNFTAGPNEQESYQNYSGHYTQPTSSNSQFGERVEENYVPHNNHTDSYQGMPSPSVSMAPAYASSQQFLTPSIHDSTREGSVSQGNIETSALNNGGKYESVPTSSYEQVDQTRSMQSTDQPQPELWNNENAGTTAHTQTSSFQPSLPWDTSSQDSHKFPNPPTTQPDPNVIKVNSQAQPPDIVSATSTSASPSTLQPLQNDPYNGSQLNHANPNVPQLGGMPPSDNRIETNQSNYEAFNQPNHPLAHMGYGAEGGPPISLPPLDGPYPTSGEPQKPIVNTGGYGLGPDVITAVSSGNIANAAPNNIPTQQNWFNENAPGISSSNTERGSVEADIPWNANIVEEEAAQMTSKIATRIDEMRRVKEASQQSNSEPLRDHPLDTHTPGNNISSSAQNDYNLNSGYQNVTESSTTDTSPEHKLVPSQEGSVPLGSHAEHYAYYQQFENMSADNNSRYDSTRDVLQTSQGYSRTPDVISAQQSGQSSAAPPSSDRNLYMQTGHLNEQDDVLNYQTSFYPGDPAIRTSKPLNNHTEFTQPSIHRPTTVPDGGNEVPITAPAANLTRAANSEDQGPSTPHELDIPLDRLVLGESETPSNQQPLNNPGPQPYPYSSPTPVPEVSNVAWGSWNHSQDGRVVTGEDDRRVLGAPANDDKGTIAPPPAAAMNQSQQSATLPHVRIIQNILSSLSIIY